MTVQAKPQVDRIAICSDLISRQIHEASPHRDRLRNTDLSCTSSTACSTAQPNSSVTIGEL